MATFIRSVDGRVQVEIEPEQPATMLPNISNQGLQAQIDALRTEIRTYRGQPVVVTDSTDMEDELTIYLYMGSEEGFNADHWYYYDGTEWVDGGEYVANPVIIDDTLTQTGEAADAKVTGDEISAIKADLNDELNAIRSKIQLVKSMNLLSGSTSGFRTANGNYGESDSYRYTDMIPVSEGDIISLWAVNKAHTNFQAMNSRFTCALDANELPVTASGTDSNIQSYTVPSGIAFVQFSISISYFNTYDIMIAKGATAPTTYEPYYAPYYRATPDFMPRPYKTGAGYERQAKETSTGINIELPSTNVVKDLIYSFSSKIGNDFNNIRIGSGYPDGYFRSYITVTGTDLSFNINGSDYTYPHGLTIADYLKITIAINDNTKAKVTVFSNGGEFTKTLGWYGFYTEKYWAYAATGTFADTVFTVSFQDINADTYIFGDSYVAIVESTAKWSHWLVADGYSKNALINAYPGENSENALNALKTILSVGCPKYILWCLGMNDGGDSDSETPSSAWITGIEEVISLCDINDIVPILVTIPSVPSYNHEAKNAWVRTSGYRYIDFAKAVGATSSGVWYSGMLSTDNVHPTELGAKALWHQVMCDFPEITQI